MMGNEILVSAYIKHRLPGRVRLKIPQKKGDHRYFDRIAEAFADCPGITQLQLNPPAASLLVCHGADTPFLSIAEFAQTNALFTVIEQAPEETFSIPNVPLTMLTSAGLKHMDNALVDFSRGRLDGRSLLFLALIGLAIHQMTRGRVMAPAASLLWYALSLVKEENANMFDLDNPADFGD